MSKMLSIREVVSAVIMLAISAMCSEAALDDGLLAYYSFDGEIPAFDCSGKGRDAEVVGVTALTAGKRGDGLHLNGRAHLKSPAFNGHEWGTGLTVSVWFSMGTGTGTRAGLITAGDADDASWQIRCVTSEYGPGLSIGIATEELRRFVRNFPIIPFASDEWNHLALTYDGQECYLYLNGSSIEPITPVRGALLQRDKPLIMGDEFNGMVDEVRIYNRVLDQDEVRNLRKEEPGRPPSECMRPAPEKIGTPAPEVAITLTHREFAQLESVSCRTLDEWVEMLRRDEKERLEHLFTTTSHRILMWDALFELSDPALALTDDQIDVDNEPAYGPCTFSILNILDIWKKGERFFAFAELQKFLDRKEKWEHQSQKETPSAQTQVTP